MYDVLMRDFQFFQLKYSQSVHKLKLGFLLGLVVAHHNYLRFHIMQIAIQPGVWGLILYLLSLLIIDCGDIQEFPKEEEALSCNGVRLGGLIQ